MAHARKGKGMSWTQWFIDFKCSQGWSRLSLLGVIRVQFNAPHRAIGLYIWHCIASVASCIRLRHAGDESEQARYIRRSSHQTINELRRMSIYGRRRHTCTTHF